MDTLRHREPLINETARLVKFDYNSASPVFYEKPFATPFITTKLLEMSANYYIIEYGCRHLTNRRKATPSMLCIVCWPVCED